jgi:hypothetical protein
MSEQDSAPLNEKDCRKPEFVGGIPIRLADGNEWWFAEPRVRFRPADTEMGFEEFLWNNDNGEFHRLAIKHEDLLLHDPEDMADRTDEWISCEIKMARMMLERNYDLSLEQLQQILHLNYDQKNDPVATGIRAAIIGILSGDTPKTSAGGDVPSPTSSAE